MSISPSRWPLTFALLLLLAACGAETGGPSAATAFLDAADARSGMSADCPGEQGLSYLCGLNAVEDLLALGDTALLLGSGMSNADNPGRMYLIDAASGTWIELVHGRNFSQAHDTALFPGCPGPLNRDNFSVHGLSIAETGPLTWSVYTTSHGEREAIEVYALGLDGAQPTLTWKGCVVLPEGTFSNSVAMLADGGFVTTKMMDPTAGFGSLANGAITGNVYEWHPGGDVFAVPGTELSGANGIAVSDDERWMYVAALGSREVVRYDRSTNPPARTVISVDITPDNIRWGQPGKLLTAGGNYVDPAQCSGQGCATGWSVLEIDADSLAVTRLGGADQNAAIQGVSTALQLGDRIWVGTFNDDRIAWFSRQ